jgi:RHS repeat-associated protein
MGGGAVDVAPNIMIAAGLGKSADDDGCAGYLVPNLARDPSAVGPEKLGYYEARITDAVYSYDGINPPTTNDLRWAAPDGLTILRQETASKARLEVYSPGDYDANPPFTLNASVTPRRVTTIEKLTSGSPGVQYTKGYQMRTAVAGKPTAVATTWASAVLSGSGNFYVHSYVKRELDGLPGSSLSESVSTRVGTSIDRTVDITTTEVMAQPSSGGVTTTSTIVHKSREIRRLFAWGEETIQAITFLTPSTAGASVTEYFDWYEVAQSDPNYATVRLRREVDGRWEAYFAGVPDTTVSEAKLSGTLRGWKNTAAPTGVTTAAGLAALVDDTGYAGSVESKKWAERPLRNEEWANGSLIAKSEDLTPAELLRTTTKRYASSGTSDFFVTVTTRSGNGFPQNTFELKRGIIPADLYSDPDPADCIRWRSESHAESGGVIHSTVIEDAAHLPSLGYEMKRDATSGQTLEIKQILVDSTGSTILSGEKWEYAGDGRPLNKKDWQENILESWAYPTADQVEHRDSSGVTRRYEYDIQGRLLRESILTVATQIVSDIPNSPPLLGQNYYNVTEWYRAAPTETGTVSKTTRRLSAKTAVDGTPYNGFSRSWIEHIDGLGRAVVELDPLSTWKNTSFVHNSSGTVVTTAIPGATGGTLQIASNYLSGQMQSVLFPSIGGTGGAGVDKYFDYVTGTYSQTTKTSHYNTFTGTNGYAATTVNGVGLTITTERPTGMNGVALNMHTATVIYDDEKRVTAVNLPIAQASGNLYSVFNYTRAAADSSEVVMRSARSTDSAWDTNDANQSIAKTALISDIAINNGKWSEIRQSWDVTTPAGTPREATYSQLEIDTVTDSTSLGTWILTRAQMAVQQGATVRTAEYLLPGTALTRSRRYVDGQLRLSITYHNGLDRLYDTNGTTYASKVATFNALRERETEVSATSGYWPKTTYTAATGLPYLRTMPDATSQYFYSWITGDEYRAGQMQSLYDYGKAAYTYYDYNAKGQLTRKWGPSDSPSQMVYDSQGRMTQLQTWRSGTWTAATWPASPPAADVTEWTYPPSLALNLTKKYPNLGGQDAARRTVTYSYWRNGALATRTWQRLPGSYSNTSAGTGVLTNYIYDAHARLQTIDYPGASTTVAATPDVAFTYNAAGRVNTRTEAGQASTTYVYTAWGQPSKETVTSLANGFSPSEVERTFDANNRIDLLKVKSGTTIAPNVDHGFHGTTGLLDTVVADGRTITYGYTILGSTPTGTPRSRTYAHGGSTLLQTEMPRNARGLIDGVSHLQGSVPMLYQSMAYAYNVDRVTSITHGHEANMFWSVGYDSRGQVTSADKKFATGGEFAAGLQTQYTFDMAGNRLTKAQGGSATTTEGTGVRTTNYGTANAANQYVTIDHPDDGTNTWLPVTGLRGSSSEVIKVNTVVAGYQQGTSGLGFHREVPLTAAAVANRYFNISVTKTVGGSTTTIDSGIQYVPPGTETLVYDADGNLIQDHRFNYLYDAENRLAKVSMVNPTVSSPSLSYNYIYTYYYDGLSRLVAKRTDMQLNPSTPYWIYMEAFVYDGWNLVMSGRSGNGYASGPPANPITSSSRMHYVWGPDIGSGCSGHESWQAAGGVGGLIFVNGATDSVRQFPLMDRMGNVTGYRRAVSGSAAVLDAVFEYDAFGREVRSTGPASNTMAFRFSTKTTDVDTGLVYYGYRFYDADRGRWLNRDPISEAGGENLSEMVGNDALNRVDVLGLFVPMPVPRLAPPGTGPAGPYSPYSPFAPSPYLPGPGGQWVPAPKPDFPTPEPYPYPDETPLDDLPPINEDPKTAPEKCSRTCSDERYAELMTRQHAVCGKPQHIPGCSVHDTWAQMKEKIQKMQRCSQARERVMRECFGGGDEGHSLQMDQLKKQLDKCRQKWDDKYKKEGNQQWIPPGMA